MTTGRGFLFGLGAAGRAGVQRALDIYRGELERDMQLLGCTRIADIGPQALRRL